jgi:hypothetical protein
LNKDRLKTSILHILLLFVLPSISLSRQDTTAVRPAPLVSGGIYDKPFMTRLGARTVIGGYMDVVGTFTHHAGINEGWSFDARRFNLFTYSRLADGIVVASEIEIEHGGEEIKLEYGLLDIELHSAVNLRGGVILSPLGKTNLVHDSPKIEFVERPLMSTEVIPSTLSEVGAGIFGALYPSDVSKLTYEIYAVNGFDQQIIEDSPETRIGAGKNRLFGGDNNGEPSFVGRAAFSPSFGSDFGVSFHSGAYNVFEIEGLVVDRRRTLTILAADAEVDLGAVRFQGEIVRAEISIPPSLRGIFAETQNGFSFEVHAPLVESLLERWPRSMLTGSLRYEQVDFDADLKGNDIRRVTLGVNLRFIQDVVLKLNYEQSWERDREANVLRGVRILSSLAAYF